MASPRNEAIPIGTTAVSISKYEPGNERLDLVIRNMSATRTVYVTVGNAEIATTGKGIPLRPYDGIAFSKTQGNFCPQEAITGIADGASAGTDFFIFERRAK